MIWIFSQELSKYTTLMTLTETTLSKVHFQPLDVNFECDPLIISNLNFPIPVNFGDSRTDHITSTFIYLERVLTKSWK